MANSRYQPLPEGEEEPRVVVHTNPISQQSQYSQDAELAKQLDAQLNGAVAAPVAVVVGQPGFPYSHPVQVLSPVYGRCAHRGAHGPRRKR